MRLSYIAKESAKDGRMNLDEIKTLFKNESVVKGNIWLYSIDISKSIIQYCKLHNIYVYGVDAFRLIKDRIQPSLENSMWLTSGDKWDELLLFLEKKGSIGFYYEIWYDGY